MQVTDIIKLVVVLIIVGVVIFHLTSCYLKNKPVEEEKPIDKREFLKTIEVLSSEDGSGKVTTFTGQFLKEAVSFEEWISLNAGERLVLQTKLLAGQPLGVKFDEEVGSGLNTYLKIVKTIFGNLIKPDLIYSSGEKLVNVHDVFASKLPNLLVNISKLQTLFELGEERSKRKKYKLNDTILTVFEYCVYVSAVKCFNALVENKAMILNEHVKFHVFNNLKFLNESLFPQLLSHNRDLLINGPDNHTLSDYSFHKVLELLDELTNVFVVTFKQADVSFMTSEEEFERKINDELEDQIKNFNCFDPAESLRFSSFVKETILNNKSEHTTDVLVPIDFTSSFYPFPNHNNTVKVANVKLDSENILSLTGVRFHKDTFKVIFSDFKRATETLNWLLSMIGQWLSPDHTAYKELLALKPVVSLMDDYQEKTFNGKIYDCIIEGASSYFKRNPVEFTRRIGHLTDAIGSGNPFVFFHARREWNKRMFMMEFERAVNNHDCKTVAVNELSLAREQITQIMSLKELTHDQEMAWRSREAFKIEKEKNMFLTIENPFSYFEQINNLYDDLFYRVKQPSVKE